MSTRSGVGGSRLSVSELEIRRSRRFAVTVDSLELDVGTTVVLGRNGAGKTTMLECLAGLPSVTFGHLSVGSGTVRDTRTRLAALARIGYIAQYESLLPRFTAREFVRYCGWLKGIARNDLRKSADAALASVQLSDRADDRIRSLSGGMRRRVLIAASVVHDPAVWILDEPTVGLDPEVRSMFRQQIAERAQRTAVLLSTHLIDDVNELANRCIVLGEGRILFDGSPAELEALDDGGHPAASRLERGYLSLSASSLGSQ